MLFQKPFFLEKPFPEALFFSPEKHLDALGSTSGYWQRGLPIGHVSDNIGLGTLDQKERRNEVGRSVRGRETVAGPAMTSYG